VATLPPAGAGAALVGMCKSGWRACGGRAATGAFPAGPGYPQPDWIVDSTVTLLHEVDGLGAR
jgi:hypothetical protein